MLRLLPTGGCVARAARSARAAAGGEEERREERSISGKLVARPHDFFLNVMGEWYGTDEFGLADAQEAGSSDDEADEFWRDLQTPEGIRRHFDTLLTGEVSEGAPMGPGASRGA
jgi:hypothetical protein